MIIPVGGQTPPNVNWHRLGEPKKHVDMKAIRVFSIAWIAMGLACIGLGVSENFWLFILMGSLFSGGALAILINWELVKKDYAKNYKKNLRQWKKTRKYSKRKY
ncbi:MAG: hypothetical protein HY862_08850 [Chloroflexi bacterium]|nr:hypothetical protein [Chloroflexota bacterium]